MNGLLRFVWSVPQVLCGLFTPMAAVACLRRLVRPRPLPPGADPNAHLVVRSALLVLLCGALTVACGLAVAVAVLLGQGINLALGAVTHLNFPGLPPLFGVVAILALHVGGRAGVWWQGSGMAPEFAAFAFMVGFRLGLRSGVSTVFTLCLSLLPLSALLVAMPAIDPQEAVLSDAVPTRGGWVRRLLRRAGAVLAALTLLFGLTAVAVEIVTLLAPAKRGSFASVAEALLPAPTLAMGVPPFPPEAKQEALDAMPEWKREFATTPLHAKLPPAMVNHWPFVLLTVYALDLGVLLLIGRVPLAYNLRNLRVRWLTSAMTAFAFAMVVGLLVFLLSFVNGMNKLTQDTGKPGNVFVLSDGATDEVFSNLGYGDLDNVERAAADERQLRDAAGRPKLDDEKKEIWITTRPVRVKRKAIDGKPKYLASRETYYSVSQAVQNAVPERTRLITLRTVEDAKVAAAVHDIKLLDGEWFTAVGVDDSSRIQCVLGEGVARTLGGDQGKPRLGPGDTFRLGDSEWVVTGVMSSEGSTFGSEIWAPRISRIYQPFGKDKYTTLVMQLEGGDDPDQDRALKVSQMYADYLSKRYTQQKLKAFAEPDYYAELTKTNGQFLGVIVLVAAVMAIGGVFGMMTTMFASIAQRIRDIGVLRLLGFKRWQVMVSFLLESLAVAFVGGLAGCLVTYLVANGHQTSAPLSSGGGGPGMKNGMLTITVSAEVIAIGLAFTLMMGRLGGLVPALSAMRMKILDSLR